VKRTGATLEPDYDLPCTRIGEGDMHVTIDAVGQCDKAIPFVEDDQKHAVEVKNMTFSNVLPRNRNDDHEYLLAFSCNRCRFSLMKLTATRDKCRS